MKQTPPEEERSFFFLSLMTAGPGLILAFIVAGIYFAEIRIAPLFAGNWTGFYTSRIYSAPHRIRSGQPMTAVELRRRLERLEYRKVEGRPAAPGEYAEKKSRFSIFRRQFRYGTRKADSMRLVIRIEDGAVRSIRRTDRSAALRQTALEPEQIFEISGDHRIRRERLKSKEIPEWMLQAVVAVEDRRFYQHPGIDLRGIGRAAAKNIRKRRVAEGGSTLTQQLARTLFLTRRRSFSRKAFEAMIALYIDARFSKKQVLRMYLDSVYFGSKGPVGIVGLVAAAKHYFNKSPKDLGLGECALLAGLLASPHRYNPFTNLEASLKRRKTVLRAMAREGFITERQMKIVGARPPEISSAGQSKAKESDHFVAYILRVWESRHKDESANRLNQGLRIYTTLDPWLQEVARDAVRKAKYEASLIALDPETGAIRALAGGKDFQLSPFDRATQARRQPGSSFKPFVYGAALRQKEKYTPATLIHDRAYRYKTAKGKLWIPKNYTGAYYGKVSLRTAIAKSLNAATVRLTEKVGPEKVIEFAREMGITSSLNAELGIGLGIYEVTLLELVGAFCPFANGGFRVEPYGVEAVLDSAGKPIEVSAVRRERVLEEAEAHLMTSLLREVVLSGTARRLKRWGLHEIAAGKTGTTQDG
ncbi:MAG: transglycosylase domain-containing protein, partial [Elusimicrobiota bacterium]